MLSVIKPLLALFEPGMRLKLSGIFLLMIAGGGLEMIGLGLFLPVLQLVLDPARVTALPAVGPLIAPYAGSDPSLLLKPACLFLLAFYAVKNIFLVMLNWINLHFTFYAEARLQQRLFRRYLSAPYEQIAGRNTAELIRTITVSTKSVFKSVLISCLGLVMEFILALAAVLALVVIEPKGALTVAALMGVLVMILYFPLRRYVARWGIVIQTNAVELLKNLQQGLGIQKEARVAGREAYFLDKFAQTTFWNAKAFTLLQALQQAPRFASEIIVLTALLSYVLVVTSDSSSAAMALPVLGVFGAAALRLMPSANRIIMHLSNIREGRKAIEIVSSDLEEMLGRLAAKESPVTPISFQHELALEDVSYRYPEAVQDALSHIRLTVAKGSAVAFVGPSGAGKSTLADLMLGLLAPRAGRILLDGAPLDFCNDGWRHQLGYVPQHIFLLDDTIRRNIAFGISDDMIDPANVLRAIEMAGLTELVRSLPDGLETRVGERGSFFSGGQRQRIGIARALYHQPVLMIFDEATSALDGGTERDIIDAIDSLRGKTTLIIIAHRISTVRNCDSIVLMEGGAIREQGTYDRLLAQSPAFQRLAGVVPA